MHGSRGKPYISHLPAVWEWCWVDPVTKKFILNKSGLKEHPIDALHQKQWDKAKTTTGYTETYPCAYNLWDAELNRVYKGVLNSKTDRPFNPDERQKIVEAQRQWIRFRDAQVKALNAHYSGFRGTIYKLSKGRSKSC